MTEAVVLICVWCGRAFAPRRDGGKRQVFCRPVCRRAFDAAGRRWVADAIASGMLTVDGLRNGPATTRALLPWGNLARALQRQRSAPARHPGEAPELLDDLPLAFALLLDLSGEALAQSRRSAAGRAVGSDRPRGLAVAPEAIARSPSPRTYQPSRSGPERGTCFAVSRAGGGALKRRLGAACEL
jgi:hypothetical protein